MKHVGSLLCSKEPANCSCLEPDLSSLCSPYYFLKVHFNIILLTTRGLPCGLLPSRVPSKTLYVHLLSPLKTKCPVSLSLSLSYWFDHPNTRHVRKVVRLIRENSFNWRCVYTHLIFFKITSLSINKPLPAVLPSVVARLEVLNWDVLQSVRHGSLQHVFNSPKIVFFQAGFEPGKQKEIGWGQRCLNLLTAQTWPPRFLFVSPAQIQLERTQFWDC